jgi:hypothetical protein
MDMIVAEDVLHLKDGASGRVYGPSSVGAAIIGRTRSAAAVIARQEYDLR